MIIRGTARGQGTRSHPGVSVVTFHTPLTRPTAPTPAWRVTDRPVEW